MNGKVYLIGAGPGAPDLLTVRAANILQRTDIVFYDALVHPDILALAQHAKKTTVGKRCGRHSAAQQLINQQLIDAAQNYPIVVRLKGGDPMLFGRAHEEISALRAANIPFEVVPGITAALAASADLGISLTQRGFARSVVFITPRIGEGFPENDWAASVLAADTAAIYMGSSEASMITDVLTRRGKPASTPVIIVENASLPNMRHLHTTLAELPKAIASMLTDAPTIILLGEIFSTHAQSSLPAESLPLAETASLQYAHSHDQGDKYAQSASSLVPPNPQSPG